MLVVIEVPDSEVPKHQKIIDIPLHFIDGNVCDAGGYGFTVLSQELEAWVMEVEK